MLNKLLRYLDKEIPFFWKEKPTDVFCYKKESNTSFPKKDTLYKYNFLFKKWVSKFSGTTKKSLNYLNVYKKKGLTPLKSIESHAQYLYTKTKNREIKVRDKNGSKNK